MEYSIANYEAIVNEAIVCNLDSNFLALFKPDNCVSGRPHHHYPIGSEKRPSHSLPAYVMQVANWHQVAVLNVECEVSR